ncbi:uncharacterized protein LOC141576110 [Camelus bactrianus]|uniref:Uncharacterized protein LOC141576110 n=1 Tax=Camelus bactrianus TaxID=9837 RepID=A0AC58PXC8_CAMBA
MNEFNYSQIYNSQHITAGCPASRPSARAAGWASPRGGLGLPAHCPASPPPARRRPGTPVAKRDPQSQVTPPSPPSSPCHATPPPNRPSDLPAVPLTPRREERSGSSSRGGSLSPRGGSGSHWRRPLPLAVNPAARPSPTGGAWQDAAPRGLSGRLQDGRALGVRTCWRPRAPFTATAADQSRRSARRLRGLTTRGGRPPWRPWKSWRRPSSPSSPSRGRRRRLNPLNRHRRLLSPLSRHRSLNRRRRPPSALSRHCGLNRYRRPPSRGSGAAAQTEG